MIYTRCKWCQGRGCVYCEAQAEIDYKHEFPDGPKPIATFKTDDPADVELMRRTIGREALEKAFGPSGGGVAEILGNCTEAQKGREAL